MKANEASDEHSQSYRNDKNKERRNNMTHLTDKETLVELRQKIQDALLKSAIAYYEAERACCEIVVPQSWKDDRKKAYDEFIWRCQDYQLITDSDDIDLAELNYDYT